MYQCMYVTMLCMITMSFPIIFTSISQLFSSHFGPNVSFFACLLYAFLFKVKVLHFPDYFSSITLFVYHRVLRRVQTEIK